MTEKQILTAETIVQQQLDSYNNRNIDSFMDCFSDDIQAFSFLEHKKTIDGKEAYRKIFTEVFEQSPNLKATLVNRIAFDNIVIDHEKIDGRVGVDGQLEMVMIYEVADNKIYKATAIRK